MNYTYLLFKFKISEFVVLNFTLAYIFVNFYRKLISLTAELQSAQLDIFGELFLDLKITGLILKMF